MTPEATEGKKRLFKDLESFFKIEFLIYSRLQILQIPPVTLCFPILEENLAASSFTCKYSNYPVSVDKYFRFVREQYSTNLKTELWESR